MKKCVNGTMVEMTPEEIAAMQDELARAAAEEKRSPMTEAEVSALFVRQQINTLEVDDNTALRMKEFYPSFADIIGKTVKLGFKFTYDGKLYKTAQAEMTIAEHYAPGVGTESLYTEICETHDGSKHDPIPYSGNMALVNGLYYKQNDLTYLCIRSTGVPVYNDLAELVDIYVELA